MLADEPADPAVAGPAVRVIQAAFREYLDALTEWGGATVRLEDLPDEPELLSYVVAAAMVIDLPERQALLAEPDTLHRLATQRAPRCRSRRFPVLPCPVLYPSSPSTHISFRPPRPGSARPSSGCTACS